MCKMHAPLKLWCVTLPVTSLGTREFSRRGFRAYDAEESDSGVSSCSGPSALRRLGKLLQQSFAQPPPNFPHSVERSKALESPRQQLELLGVCVGNGHPALTSVAVLRLRFSTDGTESGRSRSECQLQGQAAVSATGYTAKIDWYRFLGFVGDSV